MDSKEKMAEKIKRNKIDLKEKDCGVIITIYVESSSNPMKKANVPNRHCKKPLPSRTSSQHIGYDRRAKLLAYCRQLRNEGSQEVQSPQKPGRSKSLNCLWLTEPVKTCIPSSREFRRSSFRWRYERMRSKEKKEGNKSGKRTATDDSQVFRRLKDLFRGMSCKEIEL